MIRIDQENMQKLVDAGYQIEQLSPLEASKNGIEYTCLVNIYTPDGKKVRIDQSAKHVMIKGLTI